MFGLCHHVGNVFCMRTKFFFYVYKKCPFPCDFMTTTTPKNAKKVNCQKKVAFCHNKVNTKVSFCQKARTDGKVELYRTKTDVSLCKSSFASAHLLWLIDLAPRPQKGVAIRITYNLLLLAMSLDSRHPWG